MVRTKRARRREGGGQGMEGMEQVVWVFRGLQEDLGFELRVVGVLEGCGQRRWNLT